MANVGTAAAGKTLIGAGNGASPTFANIGTNSGLTANSVVLSQGNAAFNTVGPGTTGYVLTSNGAGSDPTFSAVSTAGAVTQITTDSGVVTPSSGNVNILGSGSITTSGSGATETIALTGLTNHSLLVGAGTSTITKLSTGISGQVLQSGGASADPAYSTATYPSTATISGRILAANGTNWVTSTVTFPVGSAGSAGKIIQSNGTNWVESASTFPYVSTTLGKFIQSDGTNWIESTPTLPTTAGTSGKILISDGTNWISSTPTFPNAAAQGDLIYGSATSVYSQLAKDTNATRYLSNTGASNSPAWAQVNVANGVTGTLPIANGGTNATSFTQSNGVVTYNGTSLVNYAGPQIDSSGRYTNTSQPLVGAYLSSTVSNVTGDGTAYTVIFDTESFDQGSNYNNSTGVFTAPIAGKYLFCYSLMENGSGSALAYDMSSYFYKNNTTNIGQTIFGVSVENTSLNSSLSGQKIISLSANDTIRIVLNCSLGSKTVSIIGDANGSNTYLSIALLG